MTSKIRCPVTLAQFMAVAQPLVLTVPGCQSIVCDPREFSTGSFGWDHSGRLTVKLGEVPVTVQASVNLTIVGSKEADR